jgi:hypothetical protein
MIHSSLCSFLCSIGIGRPHDPQNSRCIPHPFSAMIRSVHVWSLLRGGCGFCRTLPESAELSPLSSLSVIGLSGLIIRRSLVRVQPPPTNQISTSTGTPHSRFSAIAPGVGFRTGAGGRTPGAVNRTAQKCSLKQISDTFPQSRAKANRKRSTSPRRSLRRPLVNSRQKSI